MAARPRPSFPTPVSDLMGAILDPVLKKRAGISVGLVQCWQEIAGPRLASMTRPEKIVWPRRMHEDDPFEPATLVIACSGGAALRVQHETTEIIGRVNGFLGFAAVGRIRIVQKPVGAEPVKPKPRLKALTDSEAAHLGRAVQPIEDDALRASLERLGRSVIGSKTS